MARNGIRAFQLALLMVATVRAGVLTNNQTAVWMGDSIWHPAQASAYAESAFQFCGQTNVLRFRNVAHPGSSSRDWWNGPADVGGPDLTERWVLPWKPQVVLFVGGHNDAGTGYWGTNISWLLTNWVTTSNREMNQITNTAVLNCGLIGAYQWDGCNAQCLYQPLWFQQATNLEAVWGYPHVSLSPTITPLWSNEINQAISPLMTNLYFASWDAHPAVASEVLAAAILVTNQLGTNVSSAAIDASNAASNVVDCLISNVSVSATSVSFKRLDFRMPMALDQITTSNAAVRDTFLWTNLFLVAPWVLDNQRHMIYVSNLTAGTYTIAIDGESLTTRTHSELAAGVNLSWIHIFNGGSYRTQQLHVLNLIRDKEGRTNTAPKSAIIPRQGVEAFKLASTLEYDAGKRGTNLIAALQDEADAVKAYDTNIWTAAQGQWRTFSITSADVSVGQIIGGKASATGKVTFR
jgi:hypothetical protein